MNIVDHIFKKSVLDANERRKQEVSRKLDLYFGEQQSHIRAIIEQYYKSKASDVMPVNVNVIRKIINLTSSVYCENAKRIVTGTQKDQEIYSNIEHTSALPIVMKQANRLCNLCGTVFLRAVFRRGKMEVDVLTPDLVDVTLGDSPNDIQSVTVTQFSQNGRPEEVTYSHWTDDALTIFDYSHKEISSEPNPYGTLPFVVIHASLPIGDFWLSDASSDLVSVQDAINLHLSGLFYTLFYQGFATGFIKGAGNVATGDLHFGAGSMLSLPENGDVGFVSPDAPVSDIIAGIQFLIEQTAVQNGLPASVMNTTAREVSGVALTVENAELAEARRDQMAIFAKAEQDLFWLFRIVWNVHNMHKMSESATLQVDFAEPQMAMSSLDKLTLYRQEYELGLASPSQYMMQKNPDLTQGQAVDILTEIQAENARYDGQLPSNGLPRTTSFSALNTGI